MECALVPTGSGPALRELIGEEIGRAQWGPLVDDYSRGERIVRQWMGPETANTFRGRFFGTQRLVGSFIKTPTSTP